MDTICNRQTSSSNQVALLTDKLTPSDPEPPSPENRNFSRGLGLDSVMLGLFSADSWQSIAFAAGEVKQPERNVTRAHGHRHPSW
jgi:hypothetical protein